MKECTRENKKQAHKKRPQTTNRNRLQSKKNENKMVITKSPLSGCPMEAINLTPSHTSSKDLSTALKILLYFSRQTLHKIAKEQNCYNTLALSGEESS